MNFYFIIMSSFILYHFLYEFYIVPITKGRGAEVSTIIFSLGLRSVCLSENLNLY
jgi:hypothetical protein